MSQNLISQKPVLVIGSTVADIIINIDRLPKTAEDIHLKSQTMSIGGCGHNVALMIKNLNYPVTFLTPVGKGIYGDFAGKELKREGLSTDIIEVDENNGCCYCFVEASGERTFVVDHGAEYLYRKEWFTHLTPDDFCAIYVCGLEIEETTGDNVIDFLKTVSAPIYFAPGPRISKIEKSKMDRMLALHPIMHLNVDEIVGFTCAGAVDEAAKSLYSRTHNTIIITAGENGAYLYSRDECETADNCEKVATLIHIPGVKDVEVVDTIGAGDGHVGALIAARSKGMSMREAVEYANTIAAKIVATQGSALECNYGNE